MKKNIFQLMTAFILTLTSVGFYSCSNDDDDDNPEALIGNWNCDSTYGESSEKPYESVTFYSTYNGRVKFWDFYKRGKSGYFSYEISDGKINYKMKIYVNFGIGSYKDEGSWQYHVKGNTLYLDGRKYVKE